MISNPNMQNRRLTLGRSRSEEGDTFRYDLWLLQPHA